MATSSPIDFTALANVSAQYPLRENFRPSYGTAGFRGPAEALQGIAFRCGVVVALRCYSAKADCGMVITGSHNPVEDNGVKLVDFNGEMFPEEWEVRAELLVSAVTGEDLVNACQNLLDREGILLTQREGEAYKVFMGHDSRPSSPGLLEAAMQGIKALGVEIAFEAGLQTTPQVHYRVWRKFQQQACGEFQWLKYLSGGFMRMARGTCGRHGILTVDCANGVAGPKLERLGQCPGAVPQGYKFKLKNNGDGILNHQCGADYIQTRKMLPINFDAIDDWQRCAAVDGDVDRVIYFTKSDDTVVVLDGDMIAALAALHIQSLLEQNPEYKRTYSMGVVLTAYTNSALVTFLKNQGMEVVFVPTGVKNLHAAAKKFHVGIYYEPNGHGSIVFSARFASVLRENDEKGTEEPGNFELLAVLDTMNQTVGDAVSNILLVEAILRNREWTLKDWMSLYDPLPSVISNVKVDKKATLKIDSNQRCLEPKNLQNQIDNIVAKYPNSRAFVRPSGTEELVRIYAESTTQVAADELAEKVSACVQKHLKK